VGNLRFFAVELLEKAVLSWFDKLTMNGI